MIAAPLASPGKPTEWDPSESGKCKQSLSCLLGISILLFFDMANRMVGCGEYCSIFTKVYHGQLIFNKNVILAD